MSSALVRQALELVDPEENVRERSKKANSSRSSLGQASELGRPYKNKRKQNQPKKQPLVEQTADKNIRKLLVLSRRTADPTLTKKIVARAVAGKPISRKAGAPKAKEKSILFPDEDEPAPEPEPEPEG